MEGALDQERGGHAQESGLAAGGVRVDVDVREHALLAELHAIGVEVRAVALELGDVQFVLEPGGVPKDGQTSNTRWVIERKTVQDLAASIRDGRWREQKARLLANVPADRVLYVLEGGPSLFCFDDRMRGPFAGLQAASLQSAVVSSLLRDGIRLVWTRDVRDTAAFLKRACAKLGQQEGLHGPACWGGSGHRSAAAVQSTVASKKRDNLDPRQCFLQQLCQLPGVSVATAGVLEGRFGSMQGLYAVLGPMSAQERVRELSKLPMIGSKGASRMCDFMFPGRGVSLPPAEPAADSSHSETPAPQCKTDKGTASA